MCLPVLPCNFLRYACAPVPYILGVSKEYVGQLRELPLLDVVLVDLDEHRVEFIGIKHAYPTICESITHVSPAISGRSQPFESIESLPHPRDKSALANLRLELNAHFNHGKRTLDFVRKCLFTLLGTGHLEYSSVCQSILVWLIDTLGKGTLANTIGDPARMKETIQFAVQNSSCTITVTFLGCFQHTAMFDAFVHSKHRSDDFQASGPFYHALSLLGCESSIHSIRKCISKVYVVQC